MSLKFKAALTELSQDTLNPGAAAPSISYNANKIRKQ